MKKYITEQMIKNGLKQGIIKPVQENPYGLICYIGDCWFYFGGSEFECVDPKDMEFDLIVQEIKSVLDDFYEDGNNGDETYKDEYLYYYYYLTENINED